MQQSRDKAADSDLRGMPADLSKFYPPTPTYEQPEPHGVGFVVVTADAFIVSAGGTRHGPRGHWRESEYASCAMQTIHRGVPPRDVNRTKLWRDVNDWLDKDPGFKGTGIGKINRRTVVRVLEDLLRRQQER